MYYVNSMNKLYTFLVLVLLSVSTASVQADDTDTTQSADTAQPIAIDPTINFFTALSACRVGHYQEHNPLNATMGPLFLTHEIVGVSGDDCKVILSTPDSRILECNFDNQDLPRLADQHFLSGIVAVKVKGESKDALAAELMWSKLKHDNCGF